MTHGINWCVPSKLEWKYYSHTHCGGNILRFFCTDMQTAAPNVYVQIIKVNGTGVQPLTSIWENDLRMHRLPLHSILYT
jgi:hypothetical protein